MSILLIVKKIFSRIFFPVPFLLLLGFLGIYLAFFRRERRWKRWGKRLLILDFSLFLLMSLSGDWLYDYWCRQYQPPAVESLVEEEGPFLICVFGSGFYADPALPDACRFNDTMQVRLNEAARLAVALQNRQRPYLLAASVFHEEADAALKQQALNAFLARYGIPPEHIILIDQAQNTRQELSEFLKYPGRPILVSEAYHLPRIMVLARRRGIDALPAPAARPGSSPFSPLWLIPSSGGLDHFTRCVYELLGIIEYQIH